MTARDTDHEPGDTLFADLILPLGVQGTFTYRVPDEWKEFVKPGLRVVVQFGKNKIYSAIVYKTHHQPPQLYEAKYILSLLDSNAFLNPRQLEFWDWISQYYLCTLGEVMKAALPSGLKLESETRIILNREIPPEFEALNEKEQQALHFLEQKESMPISELARLLEQKSVLPLVRSLFQKDLILIEEEVLDSYKPKKQSFVRLAEFFQEPENLRILFEELERAPKQLELLMHYQKLSRTAEVSKKNLLQEAQASEGIFTALLKKGVFELDMKTVSRFPEEEAAPDHLNMLSEAQASALQEIKTSFESKQVALLHGITSSGKTHIYIDLIEAELKKGKQVLYLLPEIALTSQIISRLKLHFGSKAGIYHSRFNENERVETWEKVASGSYQIVLGARSAIFLPFNELSLVIIDEEHDSSFKQYDPAPRYQARDAAIYLASLYGASVLLGSATPSVESYYQAMRGKYGLIKLHERFGGVSVPSISLVNLKRAAERKEMKMHFSEELLEAIRKSIEKNEQVILFQNRRGYAPLISCTVCGHVPKCINCDVSLTYHKRSHQLSCHYCGYKESPMIQCPVCGSTKMEEKGLGTEKIEEEIQELIPPVRVTRMDLDTTRTKHAHWQILAMLEEQKIDVLVGTQMVSKGLDLGNVNLIGVMNADSLIHYPDFRAFERSFQLLSQVSGRAGRRNKQGKVIIQSSFPAHQVLEDVVKQNYFSFYQHELKERGIFHYPPFTRLIRIDLKHKDPAVLPAAALVFAELAKDQFGSLILGPEDALIPKIRNWHIKTMLMKIDPAVYSLKLIKSQLKELLTETYRNPHSKGLLIQIDVDPS